MKTTKQKKADLQPANIEVRPHPCSTDASPYWIGVITNRAGRCFFTTYAGDKPTDDDVRKAWKEDRHSFDPYIA